ncbi:MAG TPA: hypothetical protein VIS48_05480 [Candidatus Kryptonia bacterium]
MLKRNQWYKIEITFAQMREGIPELIQQRAWQWVLLHKANDSSDIAIYGYVKHDGSYEMYFTPKFVQEMDFILLIFSPIPCEPPIAIKDDLSFLGGDKTFFSRMLRQSPEE